MLIVRECHYKNELFYELELVEGKKVKNITTIHYKSVIKKMNGFTYLLLYDTNMKPISEVFGFLNYGKVNQSLNSRIKSLQALKLLYSFQSIVNKDLYDYNLTNIGSLKIFLKGLSPKGQVLTFKLLTSRSNETVNGYLSIYRQYLDYLGYENKYLSQRSNTNILISLPDSEVDFTINKYKSNEKIPRRIVEVPRYISVNDFRAIIDEIRKYYGLMEEIIVRLMFQCGLRLGETLGLTADDLVMEKTGDQYIPVAYIRNRLSDKKDQLAKSCMKIIDKKQYRLKDYRTEGFGYQKVIVPKDLFDLINEYIEEAHSKARSSHYRNYYSNTLADRVRQEEKFEDDNYYVFINSIGKPLSQHLWNIKIRKILKSVHILTDKEIKKHNLNHRFRHGFAMFNVQYLGCKEIELMHRLRHNSLQSVARYFQPTIDDNIKIKTGFANGLYELIPELKDKEQIYDNDK